MPDLAAAASEGWYSAAEHFDRSTIASGRLRNRLRSWISDVAEFGIAFQQDDPVVVLTHIERLTVVKPVDPSSEHSLIDFESIPLAVPTRVRLLVGEIKVDAGVFRSMNWTFGDPGPAAFELETRALMSRFESEDFGGEELVAKAATRLGWPGKEG
jgi:hypothetical protein